jgi:hypothetical protein
MRKSFAVIRRFRMSFFSLGAISQSGGIDGARSYRFSICLNKFAVQSTIS